MTMAKPERGCARIEVSPIIVGERDGHWGVFGTIAIGVANKGGLPVGVEFTVRDSYSCAAVCDIEESIIATIDMLDSVRERRVVY